MSVRCVSFGVKRDFNSLKFYKQHPDLAPRNIYLREGRLVDMKEVDKAFKKLDRQYWFEDLVEKVVNIFKRKK